MKVVVKNHIHIWVGRRRDLIFLYLKNSDQFIAFSKSKKLLVPCLLAVKREDDTPESYKRKVAHERSSDDINNLILIT